MYMLGHICSIYTHTSVCNLFIINHYNEYHYEESWPLITWWSQHFFWEFSIRRELILCGVNSNGTVTEAGNLNLAAEHFVSLFWKHPQITWITLSGYFIVIMTTCIPLSLIAKWFIWFLKSGNLRELLYSYSTCILNVSSLMGCFSSKRTKYTPGYEDPAVLASETSCE